MLQHNTWAVCRLVMLKHNLRNFIDLDLTTTLRYDWLWTYETDI